MNTTEYEYVTVKRVRKTSQKPKRKINKKNVLIVISTLLILCSALIASLMMNNSQSYELSQLHKVGVLHSLWSKELESSIKDLENDVISNSEKLSKLNKETYPDRTFTIPEETNEEDFNYENDFTFEEYTYVNDFTLEEYTYVNDFSYITTADFKEYLK